MNHNAIVQRESERLYQLRSYVLHRLDDRVFDPLNDNGHVQGLNGYCLDALDDSPQGCMLAGTPRGRHGAGLPGQGFVRRGIDWADELRCREEIERMINEILKERAKC